MMNLWNCGRTIKEHGEKEYLKKLQTSYSGDAVISNLEIDSLQLPDQPLEDRL